MPPDAGLMQFWLVSGMYGCVVLLGAVQPWNPCIGTVIDDNKTDIKQRDMEWVGSLELPWNGGLAGRYLV